MEKKYTIVGIDEAGRGPLAGPVVAASIIIDEKLLPEDIDDSKKISEKKRKLLYKNLIKDASQLGIGIIGSEEIDKINIHNATLKAMKESFDKIICDECIIYIDGIHKPKIKEKSYAIKHGDRFVPVISAASIIAKVTRDKIMEEIDEEFPLYNFKKHKGYPTKQHIENIKKFGICKYHRKTFSPISKL